jgi:hypothetical protein
MKVMHDYHKAEDRTEKPVIVHAIISNTYSTGGCFLRRCDTHIPRIGKKTTWVELNFQEQKDKVRHALRDAIAEMKVKQMKSVQCRHHQLVSKNARSTTIQPAAPNTTNLTTTSNVDMGHIASNLSVLNQSLLTTEVGAGENFSSIGSGVLPLTSATISTLLNTFSNSPSAVVQQLLHYSTATVPPSNLQVGNNNILSMIGMNDDTHHRLVAIQLAAQHQQLQLVQMNGQNHMNLPIALQSYEQLQLLQTEQQLIQNVQNRAAMNAAKLAIQRDCMQLRAYLASLQNAPL